MIAYINLMSYMKYCLIILIALQMCSFINGNDAIFETPQDLPLVITKLPEIYVLNLDRAPERWKLAEKEMSSHSLEINRLSAVDGKLLSAEELKLNSTKIANFLIPRGVIGCYLSHRKFWQLVVDKKLSSAIVFEDDVHLANNFKGNLLEYLNVVENEKKKNSVLDYDVLLLGAIGRVHPDDKDALANKIFSFYMGGKRPLKTLIKYKNMTYYQPRRPAGTHAYIISNAGARKLLALCPKAVFHVDLDAWRHPSLSLRMFSPMLVYQTFATNSLSDVSSKDAVAKYVKGSRLYKGLESFLTDPYTLQPLQHVLDEPIIQIGPGGIIVTVERHLKWMGWAILVSTALQSLGHTHLVKVVVSSTFGFLAAIKCTVWLLMNWK